MATSTGEFSLLRNLVHILSFHSVPEEDSTELADNLKQIVAKTEEIIQSPFEQIVKTNLKHMADRIRSLIVEKPVVKCRAEEADITRAKETQSETSAISAKVNDEIPIEQNIIAEEKEEQEDSEVSRMIKESTDSIAQEIVTTIEEAPEFQKHTKLTLDGKADRRKRSSPSPPLTENVVAKKLKYESPLEFIRVAKNKYDSRCVALTLHSELSLQCNNLFSTCTTLELLQ